METEISIPDMGQDLCLGAVGLEGCIRFSTPDDYGAVYLDEQGVHKLKAFLEHWIAHQKSVGQ